jgi:hypothetical protein
MPLELPCKPCGRYLSRGYGYIRRGGRRRPIHVVTWEDHHGRSVPPGYEVHHLCERTDCIEPTHLDLVHERLHRRHHGTLTPEAVATIRATPRAPGSGVALARQFGVLPAAISAVRCGRTWRDEREVIHG